jgi:hypothetical protein
MRPNTNDILLENYSKSDKSLSFFEYVELESENDPNFFNWLFDTDTEIVSEEQYNEWNDYIASLEIKEKLHKFIVVKYTNGDDNYYITRRSNFEKTLLCEFYDNYGIKCGCWNAGCYSFDNEDSKCKKDCAKALIEKYNLDINKYLNPEIFEKFDFDLVDELFDEYTDFVKDWKSNNENHTEIVGWTYFDGSNFRTLSIDCEDPVVEELSEELQKYILKEFTGAVHVEHGASGSEETENYIFTSTLYASDPWICSVSEK